MSAQHDFYAARAAEARAAADGSILDNVRERNLRAAAAWEAMADRTRRGDQAREKLAIEKAAMTAIAPA